ncbi:MAG: tRNA (adenosine(37)-N6)-dimethylallyltransferase MiaA [Candidatus Nanopelagicales bacterium]
MTVLAIVGPTASGKSALAVQVAQLLDGEIVGTDSMQAYRGMDIGTATPTADDQAGVHHHMLDMWDIDHAVSVVEFRDAARVAIDAVLDNGRTPIVVGGSGLYVRAVLEEMDFPATDARVREFWESRLQDIGAPALHAELAERDPQAAAAIEVNNGRRVVRALEVNELTGDNFIARLPDPVDRYPTVRIGLRIHRAELDARIAARVDRMWADGFVEEVRALRDRGLDGVPTAGAALGYGPVLRYLAGEIDEAQARQQTVDDTRRFARRQQRWFGKDARIRWLDAGAPDLADEVASYVTAT